MTTTSAFAALTRGRTSTASPPASTAQPDQPPARPSQHTADRPLRTVPGAPASGPTSRLVALPQLAGRLPEHPAHVDAYLAEVELARQCQLDAIPARPGNVVTAAHRRVVEHLLVEVRAARQRVRDGTYGRCTRCRAAVEAAALDKVPWQPTCSTCTTPRTS